MPGDTIDLRTSTRVCCYRSLESAASSSSRSSQSEIAGAQQDLANAVEFLPQLLKEEVRHPAGSGPTPADLQIARLEAEAARQSSERAARSKQQQKKQASEPYTLLLELMFDSSPDSSFHHVARC